MAEDRWFSRAVPLLEAIAEREGIGVVITVDALTDATGLDTAEVVVEMDRLIGAGFVAVERGQAQRIMSPSGAHVLVSPRLDERGARVVGVWPSADPYEALLQILERRIAESEGDERSRWRRLRDGLTGLASDVGTNVVASILVELGKAGV